MQKHCDAISRERCDDSNDLALGAQCDCQADAGHGSEQRVAEEGNQAAHYEEALQCLQRRYLAEGAGGVPAGPLYNGQDYLGNDPDPNIRSQILRDLLAN